MRQLGVFRVAGNRSRVRELKESIDQGSFTEDLKKESPHTLCSLIKVFLRDIPDPIFSQTQLDDLIDVVDIYEGK
jgi:hypothetical protein